MPLKCPICEKPVNLVAKGEPMPSWFPFCSQRCKLIDLGKWLDAQYRVPADKPRQDEDLDSDQ